jgi:hypothetical protein
MLLNFSLAKPVASSKSDSKLVKIYYLLQEHTKTSKKGKWSKSFVLCRALLTNKSRNFLKANENQFVCRTRSPEISIGAMSKGVEFGYAARSENAKDAAAAAPFFWSIQLCQLGRTSAALQPHQAFRT